MGFEERDVAFRHSVSWFGIGFRFGVGFFLAVVVCASASLAVWMGMLRLTSHLSVDSAAEQIGHALDTLPHPSIPQPPKSGGFKVDPHDRDMCLKLSNGEVNQQFVECMRENATTPSTQ